jgi:hypothetical protein
MRTPYPWTQSGSGLTSPMLHTWMHCMTAQRLGRCAHMCMFVLHFGVVFGRRAEVSHGLLRAHHTPMSPCAGTSCGGHQHQTDTIAHTHTYIHTHTDTHTHSHTHTQKHCLHAYTPSPLPQAGRASVKPGLDRLGGRSRIRAAEESSFDYLPSVRGTEGPQRARGRNMWGRITCRTARSATFFLTLLGCSGFRPLELHPLSGLRV